MEEKELENLKRQMEFIETHISWLFLAKDTVYKIKRPVKFTFLDFSTLEKRKYYCEEEVRLNRRLAPDIYLGVVPVVKRAGGIFLEGEGEILDYAVKMKRLPEERKMDHLLEKDAVAKGGVEKIAEIIADFHSKIETITDAGYSSPEIVKKQVDDLALHKETIEEACRMGSKVDFMLGKTAGFMEKNGELFVKRQKDGRIKDCHGDLHSANIFLADKIYIFDCIEFSKDFRYIDTSSEIAFMAMDLDAFGKEELAEAFVKRYVELSGDGELLLLLDYYKCYRANVRAKIAAIEYSQKPNEDSKRRIAKYCRLMERYAKRL
jgi:aminoglycoside phosphotransferase family enzyme